jgi:hypothetical protein
MEFMKLFDSLEKYFFGSFKKGFLIAFFKFQVVFAEKLKTIQSDFTTLDLLRNSRNAELS